MIKTKINKSKTHCFGIDYNIQYTDEEYKTLLSILKQCVFDLLIIVLIVL